MAQYLEHAPGHSGHSGHSPHPGHQTPHHHCHKVQLILFFSIASKPIDIRWIRTKSHSIVLQTVLH